jgi:hypothetical protein
MKPRAFWIRRFAVVVTCMFCFLMVVAMVKGRAPVDEIGEAAFWALLSGSLFIAGRYYQASKGRACALCQDTTDA